MTDFTEKKRVLVTGAGGFVGRYACDALKDNGYDVVGLYRSSGQYDIEGQYILGDLLSEKTQGCLTNSSWDIIVHCAAALPEAFEGQKSTHAAKVNREMDEFVFELCRNRDIRLVYISSSSVYGDETLKKWLEESRLAPVGPYAVAKTLSEHRLHEELNIDAVSLRICAPFGPGQKIRTVMRLFVERALMGEDLTFHGSGKRCQSFTFVKDVAEAIVMSAGLDVTGIYNIAGDCPISMHDLAHLVVRCVPDCKSKVRPSGEADPQEFFRPRIDISKACSELGWRPRVTLEEGIKQWVEDLSKGHETRFAS